MKRFLRFAILSLVALFFISLPVVSFSKENKGGIEIPYSYKKRQEVIIQHTGFTLSYSPFYKTPYWVAWVLTKEHMQGNIPRYKGYFLPDAKTPAPRVQHKDYSGSGYDRGHMAPAGDMKWNKQAMEESFYLSNVCPQNRKLNGGDWNKLEEKCRKWARKYGRVYVACGPIYSSNKPPRIGKNKVAVPQFFYKVVLIDKVQPIGLGFIFANEENTLPLENYMVTINKVEEITGLDFFSALADEVEEEIENIVPPLPR